MVVYKHFKAEEYAKIADMRKKSIEKLLVSRYNELEDMRNAINDRYPFDDLFLKWFEVDFEKQIIEALLRYLETYIKYFETYKLKENSMNKSDSGNNISAVPPSPTIMDENSHLTVSNFEHYNFLMLKKLRITDDDEKFMDQIDEHLQTCKSCEAEFKKFLLTSNDYIEYKRKKELMKEQGISEPLEYVMNMPNEEFKQKCRILSRSDAFSIIASGFHDNIEAISAVRERAKELSMNIELYDDGDIVSMVVAIAHRIVSG